MEPELRKLGLPCKLVDEVIVVENDHTVCKEGAQVNGAQAALLRHFGYQLSEFQIEPVCCWMAADNDIMLLKDDLAELLD